jgi:hypothetical protein
MLQKMRSVVVLTLLATLVVASTAQWTLRTNEWSWFDISPVSRVRYGNGTHWVERPMLTHFDRCSDDRFDGDLSAKYPEMWQSDTPRYCEKGPSIYDTSNTVRPDMTAPTHMNPNMPYIDLTRLSPRGRGSRSVLTSDTDTPEASRPAPNGGEFRISCGFSHFAFDDPLVFPGRRGASHLHMFFGNTRTSAFSTRDSIINSGNSTCSGGILNRSAYWVPAMIDTTGKPLVPDSALWYYKSANVNGSLMNPVPPGLSMIAGNASAKSVETNDGRFWFHCESDPDYTYRRPWIRNCNGTDDILHVFISFKQCWDGVNLQVSDNKRHMADPITFDACPSTHPYAIPEIALNIHWKVPAGVDTSKWRLSSDAYSKDLPSGYSMHADFMSGWNKDAMNTMVEHIYHARRDTHANNLGNGTRLEDTGYGEPVAYPLWAHKATPEDYENQARMAVQPVPAPQPSSSSQGPSTAGAVNSSAVANVSKFTVMIAFVVISLALLM